MKRCAAPLLCSVLFFMFAGCTTSPQSAMPSASTPPGFSAPASSAKTVATQSIDQVGPSPSHVAPLPLTLPLPESVALEEIGDTYQIYPEIENREDFTFEYISEIPSIATVSEQGLVTAVGAGFGRIYVTATNPNTGELLYGEVYIISGDVTAKAAPQ